jgi:predicted SAM-dependent methyltransferase
MPLLRECRRVLKQGGLFTPAVPNARYYLEDYFYQEKFDSVAFCGFDVGLDYSSRINVVNHIVYLGGEHKCLFDEENLIRIIARAGFRDVHLRQFDKRLDLAERAHESMYVAAVK